jgi:hypothetical protein
MSYEKRKHVLDWLNGKFGAFAFNGESIRDIYRRKFGSQTSDNMER